MNAPVKVSLFLTLAALALLMYFLFYSQIGEEQMAREIEQKIAARVGQMEAWLDAPGEKSEDEAFERIIYDRVGKAIHWSTNDYIPERATLEEIKGVLLANEQGDFLITQRRRNKSGDTVLYVAMTPVLRRYSITNDYLKDRYNESLVPGNVAITTNPNSIPVKYREETIFHIKCTGATYYDDTTNSQITVLLIVLGINILFLIFQLGNSMQDKYGRYWGLIVLMGLLLLYKILVSLIELPTSFSRMPVFEPDTFSFRVFYPTLGDGMINVVLITLVMYFLLIHEGLAKKMNRKVLFATAFLLLLGSYFLIYLFGDTLNILIGKSRIDMDITSSLTFSFERIVSYLLVMLLGVLFFLVHYLAYRSIQKIGFNRINLIGFHVAAGLFAFPFVLASEVLLLTIPLNALYLLGINYFRLPDSLTALKFGSVNYLILTCVLLSATGAMMIYRGLERNERYQMQRFVSYLHVSRDVESEFLLSNIRDQIEGDSVLLGAFAKKEWDDRRLTNRIQRQYMNNYFNNYEIEVSYYDDKGIGRSGKHRRRMIDQVEKSYMRSYRTTAYPGIFYDPSKGQNKRKKYVYIATVKNETDTLGYLEVELIRKKIASKRVLPNLLATGNNSSSGLENYAIYIDGQLNYSNGSYDYYTAFNLGWFENPALYKSGIESNGWAHLATKSDNKIAIVSTRVYPIQNIMTNFSFLFMLLVISICLMFLAHLATHQRNTSELYFSTKIMLYSVGSFALPLILIATAIMSTTDRSNKLEIDKSNLKRTLLLSENLDRLIEQLTDQDIASGVFEQELNTLSSYAGMDLNVYDRQGVLKYSSTPEIYENNILSTRLNPQIVTDLLERRDESSVVEESISDFNFKSSYVSVTSPDTGELLGVLQSPYFASKNHVKRQQLQVFANIINIFTFVFIISIGMAYRIVSRLTRPIMNIADKLHKTGFVQDNQPLEWKADDEIGVLVREYNNMLAKLEESKVELARNEKEAAWREMAKQVAHEIKNPLTPMKLTLQHLGRILGEKKEDKKSLEILLGQIDTLDEIVTSFSHFAKMPTPLNEPFDIADTLRRSVELHVDKDISLSQEVDKCVVNGDKKLFGRIFNNLILNAFESMKHLEHPLLEVSLSANEGQALMVFKDQGVGIPEDNRDKVFVPNFSTKDSGTGIGLAVAKRGIEHAGGRIWFESESGVGTRFFIELPIESEN